MCRVLGACALALSRAPARRVERRPWVPRCPGKRRETEATRGSRMRTHSGTGGGAWVERLWLWQSCDKGIPCDWIREAQRNTRNTILSLLPTLPKHTMSPGTERHHDPLLLSPETTQRFQEIQAPGLRPLFTSLRTNGFAAPSAPGLGLHCFLPLWLCHP